MTFTSLVISKKQTVLPMAAKREPDYVEGAGWQGGYSFRQFLGNVYAYLGGLSSVEGIQQLCHQYYLQNGSLDARTTALRIQRLLGAL